MMRKYLPALVVIGMIITMASCRKGSDEIKFATIKGIVKSQNLKQPIPNALVYADNRSSNYKTRTDKDGKFELKVPVGPHIIYVETGDGSLFQSSFSVNADTEDEIITVPETESKLTLRGRLAFIAGSFDKIEAVVRDSLGYAITELFASNLDNLSQLQAYDAVFINCGSPGGGVSPQGFANLGTFVSQGGSLFASDFGLDFFMGVYDGSCSPSGGFINDTKLCVTRSGLTGTQSNTSVLDPGLQTALGTNTIDLGYDLGGWNTVTNYDNNFWNVWVSDATYGPLVLQTNAYTNGGSSTPGNIYWTSFHNHYNSQSGDVSQKILRYVILNL